MYLILIIIHLIYIALFKVLKDTLHVTFTHSYGTAGNSGLSALLKDTSTRAGFEPPTP